MVSFRSSLFLACCLPFFSALTGPISTVLADQQGLSAPANTSDAEPTQTDSGTDQPWQQVRQFDDLRRLARSEAQASYKPEPPLDPVLAQLDYEQYREIAFRYEEGIWANSKRPFWLEFFHRGFVQQDRVDVFAVGKTVEQVAYDKDLFRYGDDIDPDTIPNDIGFAGFKIAGRFTPNGDAQEMLTFIGSSYFRARSGDTVYGSSARGLAIDIGMPTVEQFPDFRQFWIMEPKPNDPTITVLAMLDCPSLTGAYEFSFHPDVATSSVAVRGELYLRQHGDAPEIQKLAISPLTSMWMWGEGLEGPIKDERPSVHDCDGLLIDADDKMTWRAISRMPYPSVSQFQAASLKGFGLMQRQRSFKKFKDSNARYDERPSVWVQPGENWPAGHLELLELPAAHEGIDNVGAYWVSDRHPTAEKALSFDYQIWFGGKETEPHAKSPKLRPGKPGLAETINNDSATASQHASLGACDEFKIDWADNQIDLKLHFAIKSATSTELPTLAIQTVRAEVTEQKIAAAEDGYRVTLALQPTETVPPELSLTLNGADGKPISETFTYLCPLKEPKFVYPDIYTRIESTGEVSE